MSPLRSAQFLPRHPVGLHHESPAIPPRPVPARVSPRFPGIAVANRLFPFYYPPSPTGFPCGLPGSSGPHP